MIIVVNACRLYKKRVSRRSASAFLAYDTLYYYTSEGRIWLDIVRVGRCIFASRRRVKILPTILIQPYSTFTSVITHFFCSHQLPHAYTQCIIWRHVKYRLVSVATTKPCQPPIPCVYARYILLHRLVRRPDSKDLQVARCKAIYPDTVNYDSTTRTAVAQSIHYLTVGYCSTAFFYNNGGVSTLIPYTVGNNELF